MKKHIDCVYWSRYDRDPSYKWSQIIGWGSACIATRGIWVSGKYSHGDYKKSHPILRYLHRLKHPDIIFPRNFKTQKQRRQWLKSVQSWSSFSYNMQFNKNKWKTVK